MKQCFYISYSFCFTGYGKIKRNDFKKDLCFGFILYTHVWLPFLHGFYERKSKSFENALPINMAGQNIKYSVLYYLVYT